MRLIQSLLLTTLVIFGRETVRSAEANWPGFRGPSALGIAAEGKPPVEFGPDKNVLWKVTTPEGHSSPCIWGDRIFLTGLVNHKLVTLCLDRQDGKTLWQREAPATKIEATHRIASPASPTCATDGEHVYAYFGSYGLLCYDFKGNEIWKQPLPPPLIEFGTGTSPVLTGDLLVLGCDQDMNSYLLALDKYTGKQVWKTERAQFLRGFSTPYVWKHDGTQELIVSGSLWLKSYDLKDGKELWGVLGLARVANASPISGDGLLFASSWNLGGDVGERLVMPPFEEYAKEHDLNKDGKFTKDEIPPGPFRDRFSQIDVNKDGIVTPQEWNDMAEMFSKAENAVFAVRPGGHGDITKTHVVWKQQRALPYVSSPLYYQDRLYTVKSGGLLSCYDAKTGKIFYQAERIGAMGDFYASAVAADGKIYFINQRGTAVVIAAGDELKILAKNELGENVMASPAIVESKLYIRTAEHLYAFGTP